MGIGSTHSSSLRSVEADEILRDEKFTAIGFLLLGVVGCGLAVLAVTGPTGSSSVLSSTPDHDDGSSTFEKIVS